MRIMCMLLVAALFLPCAALADYDLSTMSTDELLAMRSAINAELMTRGIEKEVLVPEGTYIVGVDIPAGSYTVRPESSQAYVNVYDAYGNFVDNTHMTKKDGEYIGKLVLTENQTVKVGGMTIFAPYVVLDF